MVFVYFVCEARVAHTQRYTLEIIRSASLSVHRFVGHVAHNSVFRRSRLAKLLIGMRYLFRLPHILFIFPHE